MRSKISFRLILVLVAFAAASAGAQTLYSVTSRDDQLRVVDPSTAATVSAVTITVAGDAVTGATGLATDPSTQTLYVLLKLGGGGSQPQAGSSRALATVNPATGVATVIGDTGLALAGIVFDDAGRLWAVSGDGATPPETLFTLNPATAAATQMLALGRGNDGETIGFNPRDGLLYHASGHYGDYDPSEDSGVIFESIDPDTLAINDIPIAGTALTDEEAQAIVWWDSQGLFLWKQDHDYDAPLFRVTTAGAPTLIDNLDHQAKGLAFVPTLYQPPEPIPTLGGRGVATLLLLLALAGIVAIRRRG